MFNFKSLVCVALVLSSPAFARFRFLERDDRAVYLYPRRFGQEQPAVLEKLRNACAGQVCGTLAGKAVTPLLAAQPECSQQDLADEIIDASKQFDAATQANMLAIAIEYRQSEKNTPPDFTTNPPTLRNSVFCQKAPKNAELNGLVQAQDPANDPNIFFDPALKASVTLGSQANTAAFGGAVSSVGAPAVGAAPVVVSTPVNIAPAFAPGVIPLGAFAPVVPAAAFAPAAAACPPPLTVTVTVNAAPTAAAVAPAVVAAPVAAVGSGVNLQAFAGALGGVVAPTVVDLGGGRFQVTGNAAFNNIQSALVRSCDVQNNQCANAANSSGNQGDLNVQACNAQQQVCLAQARGQ